LVVEVDHLRQKAREHRLDYLVYDSVAFAAHGKAEDADSAISYFRCVRQIGPGSLHVAHITKSGDENDRKPFGSTFWHNSARATYFMKRSAESTDGRDVTVGVFNRKANLGRLLAARGFRFTFEADRTIVTKANVADVSDLGDQLTLGQRMAHLLKGGPLTIAAIADELRAKVDTVAKTASRNRAFTKMPGSDGVYRIALTEERVQ
jgi:hypothetical protein